MKNFTENLTYLMSDILKLSGNALAREMGINQGLVSRYRKGSTKPPVDFVIDLCKKYGISSNWLLLDIPPVKLTELAESYPGDFAIRNIEHKKALTQSLEEIVERIEEIKEKHSL